MPAGKHKGVRVALSVPSGIYNQLDQWAEMEGRPVASLCMSIIEGGLRQAVSDGLAPSVMQTRINDPMLNTKPGVTAHRLSDEDHKALMGSGNFVTVNEKEPLTEEMKNTYKDMRAQIKGLPKEEQQKALVDLLATLKNK